MSMKFEHQHQRIALASFPRSGNTWVRYLLESATGERCGSVYNDRIMPRSDNGIVIKTHELNSERYTGAVHLIRNPFDAIKSYYHWKLDIAQLRDIDWDQHVKESAIQWLAHTDHWLNSRCRIHRLRFEDLHNNPASELEKMILWLGYKDIPQERFATVADSAGIDHMRQLNPQIGAAFFRQGQVGTAKEHFSIDQSRFIKNLLQEKLEKFGYDLPCE
jgi:hypothetical protein